MKLVGHKTESIYRRYAIADEGSLRAAVEKLAALHATQREQQVDPKVVPIQRNSVSTGQVWGK